MNNLSPNLAATNTVTNYGTLDNNIAKTPTSAYSVEIYNSIDSKCSICLDVFDANKPIAKTLCDHSYHLSCMKKILKYKKVCPLCNNDIKQYSRYNSKLDYQKNNSTEIKVYDNKQVSCRGSCQIILISIFMLLTLGFFIVLFFIAGAFEMIPMGNNSTNSTI